MFKNERFEDFTDTLKISLDGWQQKLWTCLPAIIQSFDAEQQTCTATVAIMMLRVFPDGSTKWLNVPLLRDVPVQFPSGGGYTLTFPVAAGDECLIHFSSRCIDSWWQSGGTQNTQAEFRMHDLSDGFAALGYRSLPRMLSNVSTTSAQLRSDDGSTYVDVKENVITVKAATVNVNASALAKVISPSILLQDSGAALQTLIKSTFLALFNDHVHAFGATNFAAMQTMLNDHIHNVTGLTTSAPTTTSADVTFSLGAPTVLSDPTMETSVTQAE